MGILSKLWKRTSTVTHLSFLSCKNGVEMYWFCSSKPARRKCAFIGHTQTYGLPGSCSLSFSRCLECLSRPMDVLLLFSVKGSVVLASNVLFAGIYVLFPITKGLVHYGLVCNIHQPELHRGMTFESKAFLFSNDEAGAKYGDGSQQ